MAASDSLTGREQEKKKENKPAVHKQQTRNNTKSIRYSGKQVIHKQSTKVEKRIKELITHWGKTRIPE